MIAGGRPSKGCRPNLGSSAYIAIAGAAALSFLAGCSGSPAPKVGVKGNKEYFSEAAYGVKASPRVAWGSDVPRGGGRYQLGKPYQVKGRWYRPELDPDYVAEGAASWYGSAFHGRLTANGEVYDMSHLTAAHPTMPLPSYARVTNLANGSSLIVRVNDRGPFTGNRLIDLSEKAAELLHYKDAGVAKVRVEYVGPAPLDGRDERFLLASYRPGGIEPGPSDGLPPGVMIALNGPTPSAPISTAAAAFASQPRLAESGGTVALPAVGPVVPDRPTIEPALAGTTEIALLSYADRRVNAAAHVFDAVLDSQLDQEAVKDWWTRRNGDAPKAGEGPFINLGTWTSRTEANDVAKVLSHIGRLTVARTEGPAGAVYVLTLVPDGHAGLDEMLQEAWAAGAVDAFVVRD